MTREEFDRAKYEARQRVTGLDAMDGHKDRELSTILSALEAGLLRPETGACFDALVMLEDIAK